MGEETGDGGGTGGESSSYHERARVGEVGGGSGEAVASVMESSGDTRVLSEWIRQGMD